MVSIERTLTTNNEPIFNSTIIKLNILPRHKPSKTPYNSTTQARNTNTKIPLKLLTKDLNSSCGLAVMVAVALKIS
jgi:hypothetical protein